MITWYLPMLMVMAAMGAEGLDRDHLEKCLEKKDEAAIIKAFKAHEEEVLPFFDEYLENGLAALEKGQPKTETEALHAKGVAFAKLADAAFGGDVFARYARSFAGWTPQQQKEFREGQVEYRKGRDALAADPAKALSHFEKSIKLCEPLGDTWGHAMCLSKVAAAQHTLNRHAEAIEAATKAASLNGSIHLLGAQAGDLIARAQCLADTDKDAECELALRAAMEVSKRIRDEKRQAELIKKCDALQSIISKKEAPDSSEKEAKPQGK